ncbi:hypothetical protein J7E63_27975 [Bacillus sp. ISL-75]|uniref:carboxyl transferase domain-containing protein n=1 Tax=Bacillus sp. ISL-75 TaxID=2819137 RepID=UPI001BE79ED5|nr:carboxyl transferase domain-containing protein [Bacillus sp. ISL-75]MBT2730658.1 hypothetical protein [Bacillus sp. ISL-75]
MHRKSKLTAENLGGAKVHSRISSCAHFSAETEPEVLNQERKLLSYFSQNKMAKPPSYYAKKLYYVTLVYDPRNLQFMLGKFGADHIIMGTEYPFLLWEARREK